MSSNQRSWSQRLFSSRRSIRDRPGDQSEGTSKDDTHSIEEESSEKESGGDCMTIRLSDSKKEIREKLNQCYRRNCVRMSVIAEDLLPSSETHASKTPEWNRGNLRLRSSDDTSKPKIVSNGCVICMEGYQVGDTVVWSSNPTCPHAFHRICMNKYLVRTNGTVGTLPCCICRCNFTDLEVEADTSSPSATARRGRRSWRRRNRNGRRTVRTQHNFDALSWPVWWPFGRSQRNQTTANA